MSSRFLVVAILVCGGCDKGGSNVAGTAAPGSTAAPSTTAAAATTAEPAAEAPRSDVPAKLEGANVTTKGVEGNGLKADELVCKGSGSMFAMLGNVGGLSTQKAALDACVSKPEKPRVHWTMKDKKTTDVRVADASTPKVARCIANAIEKVTVDLEATCIATLVLGGVAAKD